MSIRHVFGAWFTRYNHDAGIYPRQIHEDNYTFCTSECYDPQLNARMIDYNNNNMFIMYAVGPGLCSLAHDKCASRQPPPS